MSGSNLMLAIGNLQLDVWDVAKIAILPNRGNRSLYEYSNKDPCSWKEAATTIAKPQLMLPRRPQS